MAEHAQALIEDAHQQMAEARALAAEATAAAQEAADQAHAHARAVAEKAEEQLGSADQVVEDARLAESALPARRPAPYGQSRSSRHQVRLSEHTKDGKPDRRTYEERSVEELLGRAELEIEGRSAMSKDELVRAAGVHLGRDSVPDRGG